MRRCLNADCKRPIDKCMGFVLARDFLLALHGVISWKDVREFCWKCVEKASVELNEGSFMVD